MTKHIEYEALGGFDTLDRQNSRKEDLPWFFDPEYLETSTSSVIVKGTRYKCVIVSGKELYQPARNIVTWYKDKGKEWEECVDPNPDNTR